MRTYFRRWDIFIVPSVQEKKQFRRRDVELNDLLRRIKKQNGGLNVELNDLLRRIKISNGGLNVEVHDLLRRIERPNGGIGKKMIDDDEIEALEKRRINWK